MAGFVKKVVEKALPIVKNDKSSSMECAVCLQTCVHPAELPCGHIFCYLCIKGIVNQGRRCAMCRRDIPVDYLDKPRLLKPVEAEISNQGFDDGHVWFYEGHNGWWQYDERTSLELEAAYQKGERCCELLIAGFLYVADFDEMLQSRRNDPSRRRRIKRDLATTNKKGVAGLKTTKFSNSTAGSSNETTHWSNSNAPVTADISSERTFAPAISTDISESAINNQQSRERTSFELSNSSCSSLPRRHSSPSADNTTRLSRNFNFDNVVHETLDWTLEQIESLNLELLNDYEALFRDANSYGRSQDSSNRTRSQGVVGNYFTQYLNRTSRDSPEDDSEAAYRGLDLSGLSIRDTDPLPVSTNERQSASVTQSIESSSADARPIGETRRRNFLRRSTSLNHEIGESKFS